ncbi:isoflavone reductase family protein [Aspergillus steynii IBT 23096]|uniref:Isoflavone reductase family protein n=1 Tax=Aspergillus steynii IBT 23096 TaxID=1392250 RepID=A0A2I2GMH6_9EURO|nr:isoflavone reductase family protein [Aspergillus steynii IBT 23096]PLB54077.1 isoflavone reductase family protein [Aspergillus steynii IBT 23096]
MTPILSQRPVIAIAGATGHLGQHIASAFLSTPLRSNFSEVILLSRQGAMPAQFLDSNPTTHFAIRKYNENVNDLASALQGVHILVNAVGPSGHSFKEKLLHALPHTDVQVYFPSEFGVDHYVHDFAHLEWDQKKRHLALARELVPRVKVCRVFCGLFLEDSIGPWFGFDTQNGKYESVGSSGELVSFTSLGDVGRAVAALCALPTERVPEVVHLAGDTRSVAEIAEIMKDGGAGSVEVTEVELQRYKDETTAEASWDPAAYLRFLMGEGRINHTSKGLGNANELVNPGEKLWEWKSLGDLAKETGGRPWKDFAWPPK